MFSKQKSITKTTNAIIREAYKTATALLVSSEYVGHDTLCISTGGEARTPDTRFWRPVLYQLSYSRVNIISSRCYVGN